MPFQIAPGLAAVHLNLKQCGGPGQDFEVFDFRIDESNHLHNIELLAFQRCLAELAYLELPNSVRKRRDCCHGYCETRRSAKAYVPFTFPETELLFADAVVVSVEFNPSVRRNASTQRDGCTALVGFLGAVVLTDINGAMLAEGRDKLLNAGELIPTVQCDAEHLPFADRRFDCVSIAFGLRNVTHKEMALAEMRRLGVGERGVFEVLGVTQILAWGAVFYTPVLILPLIAEERGFSLTFAMGGFSAGLLAAGFVAPTVGSLIDRYGGHCVMPFGSLAAAAGLFTSWWPILMRPPRCRWCEQPSWQQGSPPHRVAASPIRRGGKRTSRPPRPPSMCGCFGRAFCRGENLDL
jgi:hypothetical protein